MDLTQAQFELPPDLVDAVGTVLQDARCRRCGYNLRGLNHAGRCPECATPVGLSCRGDLLRFSDPTWVERLARGARLIVWGALIWVVVRIGGFFLASLIYSGPLMILSGILGSLVGFYGAWLVTAPEPSGASQDRYISDRGIVRLALAVGLAAQVARLAVAIAAASLSAVELTIIIAGLATVVHVIGEFAKLTYFHKLALRLPDAPLARGARRLRWAVVTTSGVVFVLGAILDALVLSSRSSATPSGSNLGTIQNWMCAYAAAHGPLLIVAVLVLAFTYRLSTDFKAQARLGRTIWTVAQEGGEPAPDQATRGVSPDSLA
jgi:hypothetical protein